MLCNLCPRNCNVDRAVRTGYCGMSEEVTAARAALHMWEEPCISGGNGSGAVFFTGCQLRCRFCQNYDIAAGKSGRTVTIERLAEIFLELQAKQANNINLVTSTHFVPQIIKALDIARQQGLYIPVVYNTSSYEKVETLRMLEGYVDVYLPDMKYMSSDLSGRFSNAADYAAVAKSAIAEMYRQTGKPQFAGEASAGTADYENTGAGRIEAGIMTKGVIVRHLMLPGQIKDSKEVVRYIYEEYGDNVYQSIMNQYTPLEQVRNIPELNRSVTQEEYDELVDYAIDLGIVHAFIQEGGTVGESFIPNFSNEGI